jgi:hypothetical protein
LLREWQTAYHLGLIMGTEAEEKRLRLSPGETMKPFEPLLWG